MRNLGTLYGFELKKLCQRRMLWIALAILTAASVFLPASQVMGKMVVSADATGGEAQVWSHYDIVRRQRTDPAALEGRPLDTALLRQTVEKLGLISRTTTAVFGSDNAEASVTVRQADPDAPGWTLDGYVVQGEYGNIYDTIERVMGSVPADLTGGDYYAAVDAARARGYQHWGLTEDEIAWWARRRLTRSTAILF